MEKTVDFLPSLTGSFAKPAAENPTVAMVEAAYSNHQLHYRYINCEVTTENLQAAVAGAKAMGWAGFNCSIPHKIAVIPYLDDLGTSARLIGAVNTVVNRQGQWIGENTDGKGFIKALQTLVDPAGKRVTLMGAGGAARAIAVELALAGAATISIVNVNTEAGQKLADLVNKHTSARGAFIPWTGAYSVKSDTDLVINATSVGLFPHVDQQLNLNFDSLQSNMIVADVIPNPPDTHFIKTAAAKGCRTLNGLNMLVNQGIIAIKYWTGVDADAGVMHQTLKKVLNIKE